MSMHRILSFPFFAFRTIFSLEVMPQGLFSNCFIPISRIFRFFIEAVDYKTPVECAQLCLNDAGCLSFDAGVVGDFQEGDCFLSYDNRQTSPGVNFRTVSQLDYYEKINASKFLLVCHISCSS